MFDEIDKKENVNFEGGEASIKKNIENESEEINEENVSDVTERTPVVPAEGIEDIFSNEEDDLAMENNASEGSSYNQGKEKPDVFAPVDKENNQNETEKEKSPFLKIFLIIILVVLVAVGGYFAYDKFLKDIIFNTEKNTEQDVVERVVEDEENINEDSLKNIVPENNQIEDIQEVKKNDVKTNNTVASDKDTDGDGLSDQKEMELGININNIDTDGDGLFDREEVAVYGTDPKNKDTDGDSFSDGSEVKAGYNPNGDGKLYDIK
ncbi:MAG: hypothetical protein PF572_02445 [Patescibacteria group bacterium]|jgi:hypothetical protein|nr:hypothetical protein [Patescibacteria group bacterium]